MKMPTILHLPVELWILIASDERLSRHDLAAMRLARKVFASPAASFLFRRVVFSRLKVDRDALEQIAASEHLACYVRELVWQELDLEAWVAPGEEDLNLNDLLNLQRLASDDYSLVRQLMLDASCDENLFWFPRMPFGDHRNFVARDVAWFIATLHKLPRLTALVSCRMPRERTFTYKEYPIQPDPFHQLCRNNTRTSNAGFFSYSEYSLVVHLFPLWSLSGAIIHFFRPAVFGN